MTSAGWAELRTSDPEAAKVFYSGVFGWAYHDQPMPDGPHFSVAMTGSRPIAVIAPIITSQQQPPTWISHRCVQEADPRPLQGITATTTERSPAANGSRSITANNAHDPPPARRTQDSHGPEMPRDIDSYSIFLIDDVPLMGIATAHGPGASNGQNVYFAVTDTDAALARITMLGGRTLTDPSDTPNGRICRAADPQGAAFNVIQPVDRESRSDRTEQRPDDQDQVR